MKELLVPQDIAELADALGKAALEKRVVEIVGRGARADWGNPLPDDRLHVSTAKLNAVVDYAPDDMVVTAEAGMSLAELNALLATRGQVLPLEVPFPDRTTLGGLVAAAPVPLARSGYGLVRDWLLALEVVSSEGSLIKSGARVVKSVAGYDLCKLYAGSLGTLGAIATVTFRVRPMPETSALLSATWTSPDQLDEMLAAVQTSTLDPSLAVLRYKADVFEVSLGFDGSSETVSWQCDEARMVIAEHCGALAQAVHGEAAAPLRSELRDALAGGPDASLIARASVRPSDLLGYLREAAEVAKELELGCEAIAQAQHGTVWLSLDGAEWLEWLERLRARAHGLGGSLVIERSPDPSQVDAFSLDGVPLALMRGIKQSLDPSGCLAPGRLWPQCVE